MIKRILLLYTLTTLTSCAATGRMTVTNINIINIPSQPVYAPISANYLLHGDSSAALTNSLVLTPGANISFQTNSGLLYIVGQAAGTNGGSSYLFGPQFTTNGNIVYISPTAVVTNKEFYVSQLSITNTPYYQTTLKATTRWNNLGATYKIFDIDVDDLASASDSSLIDMKVGGTQFFVVGKDGTITTIADVHAVNGYYSTLDASGVTADVFTLRNGSRIKDSFGDGYIILSDSTDGNFNALYFGGANGYPFLSVDGNGLKLDYYGALGATANFSSYGNLYSFNRDDTIKWSTVGTVKGQIHVYDGANWVLLNASADNQILMSDSIQPSGLKWVAAPSAPSFNLNQFATNALITIKNGVMLTNLNLYGYLDTQLTPERAAYIDVDGRLASSALIDATELEQLNGVTANVQVQLNLKQTGSSTLTNWSTVATNSVLYTNLGTLKGQVLVYNGTNWQSLPPGTDGQFLTADSSTSNGMKYVTVSGGTTNTYNANQFVLSGAELNIKNAALLTNTVVYNSLKTPVSASKAVVTDSTGYLTNINTSSAQIGYLSNLTSDVQAQLNSKQYGDTDLTNWASIATNVLDSFLLKSILVAKGDLITSFGVAGPARQAIGTSGQYLRANSSSLTGLEWADLPTTGSSTFNNNQFESSGGVTNIKSGALVTNLNLYGSANKYSNLTANRVLVLDGSQQVAASSVDNTHLNYLVNVTSDIQNQFTDKLDKSTLTLKGQLITFSSGSPVSLDPGTDGYVLRSWSAASKGIDWVPMRTYSFDANQFDTSATTLNTHVWIQPYSSITNALLKGAYANDVYLATGYMQDVNMTNSYMTNGLLVNSKLSSPYVTNMYASSNIFLPTVSTGERVKIFGTTNSTHVGTLFQEQSDTVPYFGLSEDDLAGSSGMFLYKNLNMHQAGLTWERVLGVDELGTVVSTALTTGNASVLQNGWALISTNVLTNITAAATTRTNFIQFNMGSVRPLATGGAVVDQSSINTKVLFDKTTVYDGVWQFVLPPTYGANPKVKVMYAMQSATSGNVKFSVSTLSYAGDSSTDIDGTSWSTANYVTNTVPGTAGFMKTASITLSNNDLGADKMCKLKLTRVNDSADTASGYAEVVGVILYWTE